MNRHWHQEGPREPEPSTCMCPLLQPKAASRDRLVLAPKLCTLNLASLRPPNLDLCPSAFWPCPYMGWLTKVKETQQAPDSPPAKTSLLGSHLSPPSLHKQGQCGFLSLASASSSLLEQGLPVMASPGQGCHISQASQVRATTRRHPHDLQNLTPPPKIPGLLSSLPDVGEVLRAGRRTRE